MSRCDYILGTDRRLFETVSIRDPRHFSSSHFVLVARYLIRPTASHQPYIRGRKTLPLSNKWVPRTGTDNLFNKVEENCPPPPQPEQINRPPWISDKTNKLMDQRCVL